MVGGIKRSCLTYTVATTGIENAFRSLLDVIWKTVVLQEFRVGTNSQNLRNKKVTRWEKKEKTITLTSNHHTHV